MDVKWQRSKHFSILGDSISTLEGYNPWGDHNFYYGENCVKSNVLTRKDTWWGRVIDYFDGELLVNNSWSGCRVTKLPGRAELFPSCCSDERTSFLHADGMMPDVIIVYLGINDWASGVRCRTEKLSDRKKKLHRCDYEVFDDAYEAMLSKLKSNYPKSEIWCCTLCETFMSQNPAFSFPAFPPGCSGIHIAVFNQIIRNISQRYGCRVVDLYSYHIPYDTIDGSHPNAAGMETLAQLMLRSVVEEEADINGQQYPFCFAKGISEGAARSVTTIYDAPEFQCVYASPEMMKKPRK